MHQQSHCKKDMGILRQACDGPQRQLREAERAGVGWSGETKGQGEFRHVYKHLMGRWREDGSRLLSVVPSERITLIKEIPLKQENIFLL